MQDPLHTKTPAKWVLPVLVFLLIITTFTAPPQPTYGQTQTPTTLTSPVRFPLPTEPEPVLTGTAIRVEVLAGQNATAWTARLVTDYNTSTLSLLNTSYTTGAWTVFFQAPSHLYPELYSLNLAYRDGQNTFNYTQPRSIWLLDKWPETLKISHLTDIHLPYGADLFATYVHETNLVHPDIVLATGDIVDSETSAEAWVNLQTIVERLTVPSYFLPGNHDHIGQLGASYQKYCGPLNYSITIGNFLLLTMDTGDLGFISMNQLQWAEQVLQKNLDKVKIIAFHHPLFGDADGANITGDWQNTQPLSRYAYFSWLEITSSTHDLRPEAKELLRLIETYDVRLILTGHIHRDSIYILNDKHYFITTSTLGGSLVPGMYHSSRLIEIDTKGNIKLDSYTERNLFTPPNSIPTGYVTWYFATSNNGSRPAVSAVITNHQNQTLENAQVEFRVTSTHAIQDYRFYSTQPIRYDNYTASDGYHFTAHLDVPAQATAYITLSAVQDQVKPKLVFQSTEQIKPGTPFNLQVQATDEGWGIKAVQIAYSTNDGATWTSINPQPLLTVNKDEYITEYPVIQFQTAIPLPQNTTRLLVSANATDFANNTETAQETYTVGSSVPARYDLQVESTPVSDIQFTIDGQSQKTPYSSAINQGNHTIAAPTEYTSAGKDYRFARWDDGTTNTTIVVTVSKDTNLTIYYEATTPSPRIPLWTILVLASIACVVIVVVVLKTRKRRA